MTDPTTRLEAALARLGEAHVPRSDWQARVLAAIERGEAGHAADRGVATARGSDPRSDAPAAIAAPIRPSRPLAALGIVAPQPPVRLVTPRGSRPLAPLGVVPEHTPAHIDCAAFSGELPQLRRRPRVSMVDVISVLAVAAMIALALIGPGQSVPGAELALTWRSDGPTLRGGAARAGDVIHATATGGAGYRAVWVYHNDRALVAACPGLSEGWCPRSDEATAVDVRLASAGSYTFVALTAASPLPAPEGSFDLDVAAAQRAGATIQIRRVPVE